VANDVLRRALSDARLTERQLAQRVGVDPATVSRWVADEHRMPQARLWWRVAEQLGCEEVELWPRAARAAVKMGWDREVQAVYPTRAAMPRDVRQRMVAGAGREVMAALYTAYSLWSDIPGLSDLLRAKAGAGCRVRFVLGDPDAELTHLTEQAESTPLTVGARIGHALHELEPLRDVVEVRQSVLGWGKSVLRCDGEAVLAFAVLGQMGAQSPHLHLVRRLSGGLFDQMAVAHTEALWEAARPVWP